eukprot:GHVT01042780.1.p1 GENE.GHVT01042780.1~~GHVT01042780.1.p1  ORF type:complete len:626 (-),score=148.34 GHVT01042780.1:125-2002(-)
MLVGFVAAVSLVRPAAFRPAPPLRRPAARGTSPSLAPRRARRRLTAPATYSSYKPALASVAADCRTSAAAPLPLAVAGTPAASPCVDDGQASASASSLPPPLFHPTQSPSVSATTPSPFLSDCACRVVGVGKATPATVISNQQLEGFLDTSDEWISSRTGIHARGVLKSSESLRSLAATAAVRSLASANVRPEEVDLVILASSTAEDLFGDAAWIASAIGAKHAAAFDLTAACSGFLFALVTAGQYLQNRFSPFRTALVIGADALSRWVDWTDRNIAVLFGDGAGAVVLQRTGQPTSKLTPAPLLATPTTPTTLFTARSSNLSSTPRYHENNGLTTAKVITSDHVQAAPQTQATHTSTMATCSNAHLPTLDTSTPHAPFPPAAAADTSNSSSSCSSSGSSSSAAAASRGGLLGWWMGSDGSGSHHLSLPYRGTSHRLGRRAAGALGGGPGDASHGTGGETPAASLGSNSSEERTRSSRLETGSLPGPDASAVQQSDKQDAAMEVGVGGYSSVQMNGREVFKFATRQVPQAVTHALEAAGVSLQEVDWLLLHQANSRIMRAVADKLGIPYNKVISNLAAHGNTSAASIPIALAEAVESKHVKAGQVVVMAGFGAGLSWGSAVMKWK